MKRICGVERRQEMVARKSSKEKVVNDSKICEEMTECNDIMCVM